MLLGHCCYCARVTVYSKLYDNKRFFVCDGNCSQKIKERTKEAYDHYKSEMKKILGIE